MDAEITARIAKATAAFGRLSKRLWTNSGIQLNTKIGVYKAAVITSLLYGCETWTLTKQQSKRLEKFHQTTLRKIARIKWFHKVTNYQVEEMRTHFTQIAQLCCTVRENNSFFEPLKAMHRAPVGRRVLKHHQTTFYEGTNKKQKIWVASIFHV